MLSAQRLEDLIGPDARTLEMGKGGMKESHPDGYFASQAIRF
jgi:hypothetical protein